uniref:bridge-like lipid transfer protein family member 1 n=1 Tax=Myxine glutinosa TaxID=7769 RepID=UPI00358EAAD5
MAVDNLPKNDTYGMSYNELDNYLNQHNSNVAMLLAATILSGIWIIYLTCYNSRNLGFLLTIILNKFIKFGHIKFGSVSFSVLSGQVMFREAHLLNEDASLRVQDGFVIFRWWRPYNPKHNMHDPRAETRLNITLNGFELHIYNRSSIYEHLEKVFGLEPTTILPTKNSERGKANAKKKDNLPSERVVSEDLNPASSWRSLIPVIKVDINTGRLVFGNRLMPQTLSINFEDALLTYATKPPSSRLDLYMHILKGKLENVRVMLVNSPRYAGVHQDEPPRLMGEGFVVLQSNDVDIYYYQDQPGLVPAEKDEDVDDSTSSESSKLQDLPPCWGLDIVCGKATDINYGPWVDKQREHLWKMFFPSDYQPMVATPLACPGECRQILAFELRMNIIEDATIDLLFTKNRETNAIHVNIGAGSYLEVNIPMIVGEEGFTSTIKGQLLHVDATTSMQYRSLLEAETLAFHLNAKYSRIWNMTQLWNCEIEVCKATYYFIFSQKNFFQDLMKDWSSDVSPDLFAFVPYVWNFNIILHQFEMVWLANQHNWVDCSTRQQEN